MMDYMENTQAVIQNLKDAGCDDETVTCFLNMTERDVYKRQRSILTICPLRMTAEHWCLKIHLRPVK